MMDGAKKKTGPKEGKTSSTSRGAKGWTIKLELPLDRSFILGDKDKKYAGKGSEVKRIRFRKSGQKPSRKGHGGQGLF